MSLFRSGAVLAIGFFAFTNSASAIFGTAVAHATRSHIHHLQQAEKDLLAAEKSIAASNPAAAHHHVSNAIAQVNHAISHHHTHRISHLTTGNGLTGLIHHAHHHHHHDLLHRALAHLHDAQKHLKGNANGATALQHVELAGREIKHAIASHHHLGTF